MDPKQNPKLFQNVGTVVGTLVKGEMKEFTSQASGQLIRYYRAEVQAESTKVTVDLWGTRKQPLLPTQARDRFQTGHLVIAQGSIQEQVAGDDRIYRSIRAWRFEPAGQQADQKAVFYASGRLGHREVIAGDTFVLLHIPRYYTDKQGAEVEQEHDLRLSLEPAQLELLYHRVKPGQIIKARGDIIAQLERNRWEEVTGYRQALQVADLEVFDEAQELWCRLADGSAASKAMVHKPAPAAVAAAAQTGPAADGIPF